MSSSSSAPAGKVSFTVRRPTPGSRGDSDSDSSTFKVPSLPRHLSGTSTPNSPLGRSAPPTPKHRTYSERDSSDEGSDAEDELVTAFDEFGAQRSNLRGRLHEKPKPQGPLVIPALQNRDWRDLARKRKQIYVPPSAAAATGADGSVGGLGTRDTINSGPQVSGLQVRKRVKVEPDEDTSMPDADAPPPPTVEPKVEETEDQKALRAILASAASGDDAGIDGPQIDIIPAVTEDDAYRQDVVELPDSATLEDYERVPVSQFGAALLRGMGWKEGQAASRKNKGLVEPWLPAARPALLGIGAKEREVFDDGSKGKKGARARPEKRYVPVVKVDRKADDGDSRRDLERDSRSGSQRRSLSPDERRERDSRRDDRDRSRYKDGDRDRDKYRDGDKDRDRYRERDRDRRRDDDYDSSRDSRRDRDRDRDRRRDRSRSKDRSESSRRRDKDRY
ncbi:DExH-box splicing factor binding site-domain-containing protein [Earliella scabrosa]|nr:DExH-box splicing factor binding site-domain-containing protein [Earliella scabrosa]